MNKEQLREERQRLALSQSILAETLGVDRMTVSRWETGEITIPKMVGLAMAWIAHTAAPAAPTPAEQLTGRDTLTATEAAEYLDINPRTLYRWVQAGELPEPVAHYTQRGRVFLYKRADLDAFLIQDAQREGRRFLSRNRR
jgi:excisionase family DNA binding protein